MDLSGRTLNQTYILLERIATSNMASVYRARAANQTAEVAVKILHEHLTNNPLFKKRFELEAKVLLQLQHPHIVSLIDFDTAKIENTEFVFLVMAFVQGGTLAQRIQPQSPMPLATSLEIMEQLLAALVYTHSENIAHRDLKPENVLFTEDNQAVLTDFGLARLVDTEGLTTATAITLGTPQYMAPEVLLAKANYQHALVDVYSLGVVFYEMVTGRTPYLGPDTAVISQKLTQQPYPSPRELNPQIPVAVEKVILRALADDPKDRYQSMAQFAAAVQPLRAQVSTLPQNSPSQNWLRFALASLMVLLIAVSIGGLTVSRLADHDSSSEDDDAADKQTHLISPTPTLEATPRLVVTATTLNLPTPTAQLTQAQPTATPALTPASPETILASPVLATVTPTPSLIPTLVLEATNTPSPDTASLSSTTDTPSNPPASNSDVSNNPDPVSASSPQPSASTPNPAPAGDSSSQTPPPTREPPPPTREAPPPSGGQPRPPHTNSTKPPPPPDKK